MSTKSNSKSSKDESKRDFLIVSTYAMAGVGAASFAWPLIDQMNPAADTLALSIYRDRFIFFRRRSSYYCSMER